MITIRIILMRTILASTPADVLILSACSCAALNSPVRYSRMDSDWVSMFVSFISRKKHCSESDPEDIVSLCLYRYSCGVDSAIY